MRIARRLGGFDEGAVAQGQHLGPDQTRIGRRVDEADGQDQVDHRIAEDRGDREGEDEDRERLKHVEHAHPDVIDPAARIAEDQADERAERHGDGDGGDRHAKIDARPVQDSAQNVHAVGISAEPMAGHRAFEEIHHVHLLGPPAGEPRGKDGGERNERQDRKTHEDHGRQPDDPAREGDDRAHIFTRGSSAA